MAKGDTAPTLSKRCVCKEPDHHNLTPWRRQDGSKFTFCFKCEKFKNLLKEEKKDDKAIEKQDG